MQVALDELIKNDFSNTGNCTAIPITKYFNNRLYVHMIMIKPQISNLCQFLPNSHFPNSTGTKYNY